ncbi:MAG: hypothetical protein MI724_09265 [Spirochaetales bacterium]|nr:hypothetical protein [Spirochaetales bacterium]
MKPNNRQTFQKKGGADSRPHRAASLRRLGIALGVFVLLVSCELFDPEEPPFVYLDVDLVTGQTSQSQALAVRYSLYNRSNKTISAMSLDLYLWDADDNQFPAYGENYIEVSFQGSIPAATEIEITSSLDEAVWVEPQEAISATEFSIHKVVFDDGSSWEDRYGQFKYPYEIASGVANEEEITE